MKNTNISSMKAELRVAAKAVIVDASNRVLIIRENHEDPDGTNGGKWGVPGGQLKFGESFTDALHREIGEETGLEVSVGEPIYVGEWSPVIHGKQHQIIGIFIVCHIDGDQATIKLSEEHDIYQWVDMQNYNDFDFMTPDDDVIRKYLQRRDI